MDKYQKRREQVIFGVGLAFACGVLATLELVSFYQGNNLGAVVFGIIGIALWGATMKNARYGD